MAELTTWPAERRPSPVVQPPEVQALLDDPRLDGMVPGERRRLQPLEPPDAFAQAFKLTQNSDFPPPRMTWLNEPEKWHGIGRGQGLALLRETPPEWRVAAKQPKKLTDYYGYTALSICSERMLEVLLAHDIPGLEHAPLRLQRHDGGPVGFAYHAFDVPRVAALDWRRSLVDVVEDERYLQRNIGAQWRLSFHEEAVRRGLFRDSYNRSSLFLSRPLLDALVAAKLQGLTVHNGSTGNLAYSHEPIPPDFFESYKELGPYD